LQLQPPEVGNPTMRYNRPDLDGLIDRVENFLPASALFWSVFSGAGAPAAAAVERLWGQGDVVVLKDKVNFKLPGMSGFPPHQDNGAGWQRFGPEHVSVSLALEPATAENGALQFLPGPWARERRMLHEEGETMEPNKEAAVDSEVWEMVQMMPGDAVVFTSFSPHKSAANTHRTAGRALAIVTYGRMVDGNHTELLFREKRKRQPTMDDPREGLVMDKFGKWVYPSES